MSIFRENSDRGIRTGEPDSQAMEEGIKQLGLFYGISGLQVVTQPGAGWACAKTEDGITIIVDPEQTIKGNSTEETLPEHPPVPPEITSLFIGGHEIGHANDYLEPDYWKPSQPSPERDFFDGLIDDLVIDRRNRRVPLLDAYADDIYGYQLPNDLTDLPKHVQLMYALCINTVVTDPQIKMDESVEEIVDSLTAYGWHGRLFDIPEALADPRTSITERRRIAQNFIWPHFENLLEEDKNQDKNQDQDSSESSDDGAGESDFQDVYDEYEQSVHGHRGDNPPEQDQSSSEKSQGEGEGNQKQEENEGNPQEDDSQGGNLAEQIAQAIKADREEQKTKATSERQAYEQEAKEHQEAQFGSLAGNIAAEMNLSPGDAQLYARSLERWSATIKEVSQVFMQLAAPTEVIMSPRYKRDAHTDGIRLHPKAMANVALQLVTGQEQPIWQPVARRGRRQEVAFGGLDVYLLGDVSGSMADDEKAECAADTGLCLLEGLQLARHRVARTDGQFHQPDVRTQTIAFGSGTEILSPLSHEPKGEEKGKTYVNLRNPSSNSTRINESLEIVKRQAEAAPERDVIALIISDGGFGDHSKAAATAASMPSNVYLAHLVIGDEVDVFISNNHESLKDANLLPGKLYEVLENYIKATDQ